MIVVNYSTVRTNLKSYCDRATDEGETVIVTRKGEKNVVILSLEDYNRLIRDAANSDCLSMLARARAQLESGKGQIHDLIEEAD